MTSAIGFRALELHGRGMWEGSRLHRAFAFMKTHGLNALVLNEGDLLHHLVYPRAYFDPYALWKDLPSRRGENAIFNNRAYLQHILALAREAGVEVWLNTKEIAFSDEVLSIRPDLFKNGAVCPSEPFWEEYIGNKVDELFSDFPDLAGLIVSMGSQESRAAKVQNRCGCQLCRAQPLEDWYAWIVGALHAPASRHGKRLAIRDFAYKPSDHAPLIGAVRKAPQDVIFCIKATPHDFYVTFPDNPAIGALQRDQFIEYDAMGQFVGWGVMPCLLFDDLARRVPVWTKNGVQGVIFRTEWERINDLDCFDNLSEINLIAGAALAAGEAIDATEACRRWLAARGFAESGAAWLAGLLAETLPVVRRAAYINDAVSADNSMLPRSIQRAWWGAEARDSLAVWDVSREGDLVLNRSKVAAYVAEKDEALRLAERLIARLRAPVGAVETALRAYIASEFDYFLVWVQGLRLTAIVCLYARWIGDARGDWDARDLSAFEAALTQLDAFAGQLAELTDNPAVPHQVAMLIDPKRARDVANEGWSIWHKASDAPQREGTVAALHQ